MVIEGSTVTRHHHFEQDSVMETTNDGSKHLMMLEMIGEVSRKLSEHELSGVSNSIGPPLLLR